MRLTIFSGEKKENPTVLEGSSIILYRLLYRSQVGLYTRQKLLKKSISSHKYVRKYVQDGKQNSTGVSLTD